MKIKISPLLCQLWFLLLLVPILSQVCHAQTLYQRSSSLLEARMQRATPDDYTFVVLGDSRDGDEKFKEVLKLARSFAPLFILHCGDYSYYGGEAETSRFLSLVQQGVPRIPLFVVIGNHENRDVFTGRVGPRNFTLSSKRLGFKLVALDNADSELRAAEQDRLRGELASKSGAVFVAMHIPPKTGRWRGHTFTAGADPLQKILTGSGVQGLFFAHSHLYDRSEFAGIPAFITGGAGAPLVFWSWFGKTEHHIIVVRVKNGKASYRMVPLAD